MNGLAVQRPTVLRGRRPAAVKALRSYSALALIGALVGAGCMGPLKPGLGVGEGKATPRATADGSPPAGAARSPRPGIAEAAPDDATLVVGSETLAAEQVWRRHREELLSRAEVLSAGELQRYIESRAAQLVADTVTESLLHQRASQRLDDRLTEAVERQVDAEVRKTVTARHNGVQRRLEKELESKGQSLAGLREQLRREILVAGYLDAQIKPKVAEPTRADLLAAFRENASNLRKPTRRSMSLIDVRVAELLPKGVESPSREEWAAAREQALERIRAAREMIVEGAAFADVARSYSHGLHATEGGRWGWITAGSVRERFLPAVEALETLDAGQVSDVVETNDGFFLVRCDELDPGFEPDFESVQPELADRFFRIQFNRLIAEHVDELRRKAGVGPADLERFHAAVVEAAYAILEP